MTCNYSKKFSKHSKQNFLIFEFENDEKKFECLVYHSCLELFIMNI